MNNVNISKKLECSEHYEFYHSMCNQMVTSEIIPTFHEYTIWLPFHIMGDELR